MASIFVSSHFSAVTTIAPSISSHFIIIEKANSERERRCDKANMPHEKLKVFAFNWQFQKQKNNAQKKIKVKFLASCVAPTKKVDDIYQLFFFRCAMFMLCVVCRLFIYHYWWMKWRIWWRTCFVCCCLYSSGSALTTPRLRGVVDKNWRNEKRRKKKQPNNNNAN